MNTDLEYSSFQKLPTYRYIRVADKVPTYDQIAEVKDPLLLVRLFNPGGQGTWWIASYDPDTRIAFGVAKIQELEIGYFSMAELVDLRGGSGLPIERDLYWQSQPISAIIAEGR